MFIDELSERSQILEGVIGRIEKELPGMPEGNLRITKKRKKVQYYHVTTKENMKGTYIPIAKESLVKDLAKKTYYEKLLREAKRENRVIKTYIKGMKGKRPEDIYSDMNDYRKELISPLIYSDSEYAKEWENKPFTRNPYHPEECIYETKKGDMVRTKSEAMLADMYYELGIAYRYEAPVKLYNGKIKYPDFTLLKFPERKEIYHEHMGLMEDEFYRRTNLEKLRDYEMSGITSGNNLILSFETDYLPLNIKSIRKVVKKIFYGE